MDLTAWVVLGFLCFPGLISSQEEDNCIGNACYPSTGDLLVGRGDRLYASSTCGLRDEPESFCIISNLNRRGSQCQLCDSRPSSSERYSHAPKYMVILFKDEPKTTWWQSENGKENVYLQLDFEAQFHVTHIVMKWESFRPAAMLIERSYDYKKTWEVSRYYAKDCKTSFPGVPVVPPDDISKPYCTSEYSSIEPSSGGEVVYKALSTDIDSKEAWSNKTQNLLRMTNIRINFTKLNTLGDDIIDNSLETNKKYYYAVNWISIRGSCSCYGHAKRCLPKSGDKVVPGMVHSVCNCTHNTAGLNCEYCKDGYHDRPWKPAFPNKPNECKKCECHGHSDQCRFDQAVWDASGQTSGGVCLDCQHNTIGPKCEKCKPLHYKDPALSIRDPNVCRPCDCDPVGSVGRGECQMEEDPIRNLRAGECICKENVEGTRCDRCKDGYFNLRQDNLKGCEACACDVHGAVGKSCDVITGRCRCKRFVEGEKCDKCFDGYWGLQSGAGCKACDCDPGGAYDNLCDPVTGQCRCRSGIEGRKCDRVIPGYYYALSDNLKYEAEEARGIGITSINLLERPQGTKVVWTDVGSLNISEGNGVEFVATNVPMTGNYKVLLRFHPKTLSFWEEVKISVSRADGRRTVNGACGNALSSNGFSFVTTVQVYEQTKLLEDLVCLEEGVHYYVRVDFNRQRGRENHVNLDSLVLIPDINSVSVFEGGSGRTRLNNFIRFRCEQPNLPANVPRPPVHSICQKLHFSGSAVIYDGALSCDCDQVGTIRNDSGIYTCDDAGGQCPCKPSVIGRRCRKCAPGTYKFGPDGCLPCACDLRGSHDNLCDVVTGECKCNDLGIGRQCNECPAGQWGFPRCRPCECNGHASSCHPVTGVCIDCAHNTAGDHCELCKPGYFGNASKGTSADCQQCQCPGGSSENQFSPTCKVDTSTTPPSFICDKCPPGYEGKQCEKCSDGFYGNPLVPGGKCEKCNCNGNVNFTENGGCDKRTGECLRCLHNTAGYFCDVCKRGYYGNAKNQTCRPCSCNEVGTDLGSGPCNPTTGECPCKPNVLGLSCDRCAPGYWDLASGDGCKPCGCCAAGSTSTECDQLLGVCQCRRDFGGPKCCDCEEGFWGVPPGQCTPCDCNPNGSLRTQCDRHTGDCFCKPGVTGRKCDKCEPETTQEFPECEACHDCYYSWDKIITELERIAWRLKGNVTSGGAGGTIFVDYEKELDALDKLVQRIEYILSNRTTYPKHVQEIEKKIEKYREKIMDIMNTIDEVHGDLDTTEAKKEVANNDILKLRKIYERLRILVEGQLSNLTNLKDKIPRESYNTTLKSLEVSNRAFDISEDIKKTIEDSALVVREMYSKIPDYEAKKDKLSEELKRFLIEWESLDDLIKWINSKLCGKGAACGGCNASGCDHCGGEGCDGAVHLAKEALEKARLAERALWKKERDANATLDEVMEAQLAVETAMNEAKVALELAKKIQFQASNDTGHITDLIQEIYKFLNRSGADPEEVRKIAKFVLGRNLIITEEEIKDLARRIREAVEKLTGIDGIIRETEYDLGVIEGLRRDAILANSSANDAAGVAKEVSSSLNNVVVVQDGLRKSLKKAKRKIEYVEVKLLEVETILNKTLNQSSESVRLTSEMKRRLAPLEKKFDENEKDLVVAETEVKQAVDIAAKSKNESEKVKKYYDEVMKIYNDKLEEERKFRNRAEKALEKAEKIKQSFTKKLRDIEGYLIRRKELDDLIEKLKKLDAAVLDKFCEINYDTVQVKTCKAGASIDQSKRPKPGTFCDLIVKP